MLSKEKQSQLRSKLFRHLDGIVVAPSAYALKAHGITDRLQSEGSVELGALATEFKANDGYLNVALRTLCSQGWLTQHVDNDGDRIRYEVNEISEIAFGHFDMYKGAVELLQMSEH